MNVTPETTRPDSRLSFVTNKSGTRRGGPVGGRETGTGVGSSDRRRLTKSSPDSCAHSCFPTPSIRRTGSPVSTVPGRAAFSSFVFIWITGFPLSFHREQKPVTDRRFTIVWTIHTRQPPLACEGGCERSRRYCRDRWHIATSRGTRQLASFAHFLRAGPGFAFRLCLQPKHSTGSQTSGRGLEASC